MFVVYNFSHFIYNEAHNRLILRLKRYVCQGKNEKFFTKSKNIIRIQQGELYNS